MHIIEPLVIQLREDQGLVTGGVDLMAVLETLEVDEDFRGVGRWEEIDQLDLEFKSQWFDVVCLVEEWLVDELNRIEACVSYIITLYYNF